MVRDAYDFIVIGAGPNGLAAGAYLAMAGQTVLEMERRPEAGGGLATEAVTLSDFSHNTHAVYMMMVDYAPIYRDFMLEERYQVKHLYPSLQFVLPLSDGKAVCIYSDVEKTCRGLARFSQKDAEGYRALARLAEKAVREFIGPATYAPPVPALDQVVKLQNAGIGNEILEYSEKTPLQIVNEFFHNEHVRALMLYVATQWGIAPDQPGLGYLVLLYLNRAANYRLVKGGSHMVPQALNKIIHENGGAVWNNVRIKRIIIEGGAATGVELTEGTILHARKGVISTVDPQQTFLKMVGEDNLDAEFVDSIKNWQWEKHSLLGVHLAMTEPPQFAIASSDPELNQSFVYVLGYETPEDLVKDQEAAGSGILSDQPAFNCCFPTVHDPSQAPPGRHTGLLSRFAPYHLKQGTGNWYRFKFKEAVAEKCLETLRRYAPNMTGDKVLWKYVTTPVDIENKFNDMVRGSFKQGLYDPFQMGYLRPNERCSNHRTPINNLFFGGSSSYPGGCVIWGPGYLAANAVAEDLGINKWWPEPEMVTRAREKGLL